MFYSDDSKCSSNRSHLKCGPSLSIQPSNILLYFSQFETPTTLFQRFLPGVYLCSQSTSESPFRGRAQREASQILLDCRMSFIISIAQTNIPIILYQFTAIFFWECIPQYAFPLLTAISVICIADNGRHDFVRNLFGAGSSNEGIGLFSFSTSWILITQGTPLVWPLQTRLYLSQTLILSLKFTWLSCQKSTHSVRLINFILYC